MQWLRMIRGFVRVLVALFIVAQFAGVVSSPLASAKESPAAVSSHLLHDHDSGATTSHSHQNQTGTPHSDTCCALHAFFAGILPVVIAVEAVDIVGQRLATGVTDIASGIEPDRLDRPPRPFAVI